jgi:lipopolysaccharide transport system ATP-binding protein
MSNIVIKAEDISKQYRLGLVGTGTVKDDFKRWWHKIQGKEDPFLKIGDSNDRSSKGESNYVWSLKDINFEINQGDSVGIIGKNGAGKSTLLKILSQVTQPTTGKIYTKGRIASLLEVGTGFHPEMTGRENIYLNGAILGMRKKEITQKLAEIIDFSGVERYIDTPVKRYSSGMYVRLAFAVAAHLESEILIVDEVLAVGDAEFQKKCLGKMGDVTKGEGRTVLFVSHNMAAVKNLCSKGIFLENGLTVFNGNIEDTINRYLQNPLNSKNLSSILTRKGDKKLKFVSVEVFGTNSNSEAYSGSELNIIIFFENKKNIDSKRIEFDLGIEDEFGIRICWLSSKLSANRQTGLANNINIKFPINRLNDGNYFITLYITVDGKCSDWIDNAYKFIVHSGNYYNNGRSVPNNQSKVLFDFEMEFNNKTLQY